MTDLQWRKIALFAACSDKDLETIKPIFALADFPAGEKIIVEGDSGDTMYILVKGRVRITKSMIIKGMKLPLAELEDPRKVLATLDGEQCPIFGEMALLDRDTRSATVETLAPSQFLTTNQERFFSMVEQEPALGAQLLAALGRRLAATVRKNNGEIVKLTTALALALSRQR